MAVVDAAVLRSGAPVEVIGETDSQLGADGSGASSTPIKIRTYRS